MRNLSRLNNVIQLREAWRDWDAIARFARENGQTFQAAIHQPDKSHGWRNIDKRIAMLRKALTEAGLTVPASPSAGSSEPTPAASDQPGGAEEGAG